MRKKKRVPQKVKGTQVGYKISKWLHNNKNIAFNIPFLTEEIGMKPDSRKDCSYVYNVLLRWRKAFIESYQKYKRAGQLDGMDRYEAWDTMLFNFNQNDMYVFLFDKKTGSFLQPSFDILEKMDKKRLQKQWKGINTVIEEMIIEDARLLTEHGIKSPIDLLRGGKKITELLKGKIE